MAVLVTRQAQDAVQEAREQSAAAPGSHRSQASPDVSPLGVTVCPGTAWGCSSANWTT